MTRLIALCLALSLFTAAFMAMPEIARTVMETEL